MRFRRRRSARGRRGSYRRRRSSARRRNRPLRIGYRM